jgi:hypothetical protein
MRQHSKLMSLFNPHHGCAIALQRVPRLSLLDSKYHTCAQQQIPYHSKYHSTYQTIAHPIETPRAVLSKCLAFHLYQQTNTATSTVVHRQSRTAVGCNSTCNAIEAETCVPERFKTSHLRKRRQHCIFHRQNTCP